MRRLSHVDFLIHGLSAHPDCSLVVRCDSVRPDEPMNRKLESEDRVLVRDLNWGQRRKRAGDKVVEVEFRKQKRREDELKSMLKWEVWGRLICASSQMSRDLNKWNTYFKYLFQGDKKRLNCRNKTIMARYIGSGEPVFNHCLPLTHLLRANGSLMENDVSSLVNINMIFWSVSTK